MNFYLESIILGLALSSLSLGIFISMKIFKIPDITTDGSYTLGAVITTLGLLKGWPIGLVLLFTFLISSLAGACTGFISTYLKVNPLLAGILMMTSLYSINLTLLGRSNTPLVNVKTLFSVFHHGDENTYSEFIILGIVVIFIGLILAFLLKSDFGIAMRATGDSESMVRSMGVNTSRMKILGLALANGLIGISGSLVAQYQGFVDVNMGVGVVITGLGSVVLGDAILSIFSLQSIPLKLIGVILGAVIFQLVLALSISLGIDPNLLKLTTAVLVLFVVSLPLLKFTKN